MPSDTDLGRPFVAHLAKRTAVVVAVVVAWYFSRPLWHGLVYSMLFSPSAAVFLGGSLLAALVLWYVPPSRVEAPDDGGSVTVEIEGASDVRIDQLLAVKGTARRKLRLFGVVVGVLFVLSVLVGLPAGALEQRTLAQQTTADATELEEFPQANPDNPRVVPREVSDITTRGSVSYRTHRLGPSDIARKEDGSLGWSYAIQPDGFRNRVVENQRGVLITGMTSLDDRPIDVHEEDFEYGQGMFLHRSADWRLKSTDYIARYNDEAVEFSHDGRPYMYYAKTGHEWHLTPFPHTTPTWDGGALVHPDGTVDHLSPAEARDNPILDGQRLYPLTLARSEMGSLGYRNGIVNQLPVVGAHEGEVEIAGLPAGTSNSQPFVIDLAGEQMSYVTAMEPYGEDTRGLDEVWFADAETGEYTFFGTDEATLTGPERAMGIARSADSRTNWGENFVVTEPVPVTVEGDLWWHIKVAPTDFTDVTRNVFVNAESGEAVEINDDAAIRSFISGNVSGVGTEPGQDRSTGTDDRDGGGGDGPAYYIVVTDENGTVVERIPVGSDQDTRIVPAGREGNRTASDAG
ncbi:MAG: hypothetical protein BRD23_04075 [Halobacteriales archaeon SW_9_67_25]|jgi:hypothetical protein|nr:MAG: hypothetical protein BRD23_04075 [Halobacteriales archaeon SW_9_67_25]